MCGVRAPPAQPAPQNLGLSGQNLGKIWAKSGCRKIWELGRAQRRPSIRASVASPGTGLCCCPSCGTCGPPSTVAPAGKLRVASWECLCGREFLSRPPLASMLASALLQLLNLKCDPLPAPGGNALGDASQRFKHESSEYGAAGRLDALRIRASASRPT